MSLTGKLSNLKVSIEQYYRKDPYIFVFIDGEKTFLLSNKTKTLLEACIAVMIVNLSICVTM